ncbi:MAG: calcium-translocating P-type ATPase, PMCA-type [Bacteroidales bacterium]
MESNRHITGLNNQQVEESRRINGRNILTPPKKTPIWKLFLEKFEDPIVKILLFALFATFVISSIHYYQGDGLKVFLEPVGIFVAIILATGVGFIFEQYANKKFEILNQVNDETAVRVIRDGNVCEIIKSDVVVGDIVVLSTGDEVPADGVLIEAVSLQIDESSLTGEPLIKKSCDPLSFHKDATYPTNSVMKGTNVRDGHGIYKVEQVGDSTEYGKVFKGSQIDNNVITPLNQQLDALASMITKVSYAIAITILVVRMSIYISNNGLDLNSFGIYEYLFQTIMVAVTVIVVAVPEGLPMSVTLSLALSMKRMLSTNNLVRKMHACETMGATTVICTDKTGTLTQNQMKVYESRFYSLKEQSITTDETSTLISENISINSTAYLDYSDSSKIKGLGNPTESALLLWLHGKGINYLTLREETKVVDQLTFSTERKFMATLVDSPKLEKRVLYVKGAPEIILSKCSHVQVDGKLIAVEDYKNTISEELTSYQNKAMRTLGFAFKELPIDTHAFEDGKMVVDGLIFNGVVAISDPVREDVPDAIKDCISAGINVKIVTGDTPGTAKEIGRQISLWNSEDGDINHMTGPEFEATSDKELLDRIDKLKIMSRARPMDKERLVRLLQERKEVVAVTGDGTNDAPALNRAQVGLSMGDGTSVAKEASDITILDNSFSSIVRAVMWGRSLYQNIQRFIVFQMTINVAACIIVLIGAFIGSESPLTVTQMLWVNLIMDTFAAMALASLPPSESVMDKKPRSSTEYIITKEMAIRILGVGFSFVLLLFGLLQYFKYNDIESLTQFSIRDFGNSLLRFDRASEFETTPYELSLFFSIFVLLQFWNMFNAKALMSGKSAFSDLSKSIGGFGIVSLLIVGGQFAIVNMFGEMFNAVAISMIDWMIIIVSTSTVLWIGEILRLLPNRDK